MYFCTALSLIIMLSSHYHLHKSKSLSQLTQCPFTGTLLLFSGGYNLHRFADAIGLVELIVFGSKLKPSNLMDKFPGNVFWDIK